MLLRVFFSRQSAEDEQKYKNLLGFAYPPIIDSVIIEQ